jgi:hypothetical protein
MNGEGKGPNRLSDLPMDMKFGEVATRIEGKKGHKKGRGKPLCDHLETFSTLLLASSVFTWLSRS